MVCVLAMTGAGVAIGASFSSSTTSPDDSSTPQAPSPDTSHISYAALSKRSGLRCTIDKGPFEVKRLLQRCNVNLTDVETGQISGQDEHTDIILPIDEFDCLTSTVVACMTGQTAERRLQQNTRAPSYMLSCPYAGDTVQNVYIELIPVSGAVPAYRSRQVLYRKDNFQEPGDDTLYFYYSDDSEHWLAYSPQKRMFIIYTFDGTRVEYATGNLKRGLLRVRQVAPDADTSFNLTLAMIQKYNSEDADDIFGTYTVHNYGQQSSFCFNRRDVNTVSATEVIYESPIPLSHDLETGDLQAVKDHFVAWINSSFLR